MFHMRQGYGKFRPHGIGGPRFNMDFSSGDVTVRHIVAFKGLNLIHTFDCSPSILTVLREVKQCIFVVAGIWAATSLFKS